MTDKVPAGAKKPSDRKVKDDKPKPVVVTVRGVEVTVDPEVLDDWTYMEDLAEAQADGEDSIFPAIRVLKRLAGPAYKELRATAADDSGRVTIEAGAEQLLPLVQEILEAASAPNS